MDKNDKSNQLRVLSFEPHLILIEIIDFDEWKTANSDAQISIGSFLKIEDGNRRSILTSVYSFKIKEHTIENGIARVQNQEKGTFIISTQPIGQLEKDDNDRVTFVKGIKNISIPPAGISLATEEEMKAIFRVTDDCKLIFAEHLINKSIKIELHGNRFFSKHIAVVGSTGSGKSCSVAKIIQEAQKSDSSDLNNTHIIIFDIHGEYKHAFTQVNYLSIENNSLKLPYWLMNSEEIEDMFIESAETNSHNQVSQFKFAVIENKKKHNPNIQVTYDSPVYFSLDEVYNYICNKNNLTTYEENSATYLAVKEKKVEYNADTQLWEKLNFVSSSGQSKHPIFNAKVSKEGGFYGEFDRFISRLETKMQDNRLNFILKPDCSDMKYRTEHFAGLVQSILGYTHNKSNTTVVDLSSLPFEIVSLVVSIMSRLVFDFSYYNTKLNKTNKTPFMLVYEEAHKYIPKNYEAKYKNTRLAVERIAKEGRKYGVSAMIVSQRPSEISSTVFSQCNNFVVMRLNNPDDQSYVKRLLPETVVGYSDALSSLEKQEALLVGDAIATPIIAKIMEATPLPKSEDVLFYTEWKKTWQNMDFEQIINSLNKQNSCNN